MNNNHTDNLYYPATSPTPPGQISPAECIPCPSCGETAFLLRRSDRKLLCARCGNPMEQQVRPTAVPQTAPSSPKPRRKPVQPLIRISSYIYGDPFFICTKGTAIVYEHSTTRHSVEPRWGFGPDGIYDVQSWFGITSIAAGHYYTVGLRSNGTVVAVGKDLYGECNVHTWSKITAIATTGHATIGLCSDGTVKAVGNTCYGENHVQDWSGITAIAAGFSHVVGLCANGTVKAVGSNIADQCNVQNWSNITAIAAYGHFTVGLRSDGTVVATGSNEHGQCNVQNWTNVIAIAAGYTFTVGLCENGTLLVTGNQDSAREAALSWRDIVSIQAFGGKIAAMQSNGLFRCTIPEIQVLLNQIPRC